MTVTNVTTITVQGTDGWNQMMENTAKAKAILEKHGVKNFRLLVPVSGGSASGTVHNSFEVDDFATLGRVLDAIYTDPDMIALMTSAGDSSSWVTSVLMEIPLS